MGQAAVNDWTQWCREIVDMYQHHHPHIHCRPIARLIGCGVLMVWFWLFGVARLASGVSRVPQRTRAVQPFVLRSPWLRRARRVGIDGRARRAVIDVVHRGRSRSRTRLGGFADRLIRAANACAPQASPWDLAR